MDEMQETARRLARDRHETPAGATLPPLSNAERDFWRRAVEIERRRQRCGRPTPFPFQPA